MESSEALVIEDVHKRLGAVRALDGVSFTVPRGTVHGIIGHNGSGKSTLVKILAGILSSDRGSFQIADIHSSGAIRRRRPRVATVFQDLGLADHLTVYENILVNNFRRSRFGFISDRRERARLSGALSELGFELPFGVEAGSLSEADRVILCVARALFSAGIAPGSAGGGADILLMDEPTSSLPREELEKFRTLVQRLRKEEEISIVIVTHNPSDVGTMCDDVTALKGGRVLCTMQAREVSMAMLAELMAGKERPDGEQVGEAAASLPSAASRRTIAGVGFAVSGLCCEGLEEPVTLSGEVGELLGITGLEGSGFRELVAGAVGVRALTSGEVSIADRPVKRGIEGFRQAGGVYIPADRTRTSGVPDATVYENMTLGIVDSYTRFGVIQARDERVQVARMLERLNVHPSDPRRKLSELSGGQQQKVIVGRALLASKAKVVVFEEPTAAVDVGAREDILRYLRELASTGTVVVVATAEFEWLPSACDRIAVFRSGRFAGELRDGQMNEQGILRLAYGA